MNRRRFLTVCAGASLAACAPPPEAGALPAALPRDYRRCLPEHLRALAARARELRIGALDALDTADAVRRRQAWARETLWRLLGGMPDRTPISIRLMGSFDRPGYRVEKLVYESRPGLHVTANLYLPSDGRGPFPGVLFQMGHHAEGKGAADYQRACQALVKLGYVVLGFDPAGQGERRPRGAASAAEDEHDRLGRRLLLAGDSATRLMLWDAVRSLDVLASRPEVDPARLASAGQSGGGTLTMFLAAADDRLAAAAISCANTEDLASAGFDPPGAVDDAEQDVVGAGPAGFDRWDLLYPLAPKPLLVLESTVDPFTTYSPSYLVDGHEERDRLIRAYGLLGVTDRVRWVESDEPHGLTQARRIEMERWLGRFLLGEEAYGPGEPETSPEPEDATWCVPGGDVVRALGGKTPLHLAQERAAELAATVPAPTLASLLGRPAPSPPRAMTLLASDQAPGCVVESVEVASAPEVQVPAWLVRPEDQALLRVTWIVLPSAGRPPRWEDDPRWLDLAREGHAVLVADVRGTGALRPELGPGASGYAREHGVEAAFAWASLVLGESLLAQRVADILALVEGWSRDPWLAGRPLLLAADGATSVAGLFAAALEPRIAGVYLEHGLASYRRLLDAEDDACPPADVLPGVLAATDIPDVAARMCPRPVILAAPVDGAGRPLPVADARALYARAPNVRVEPEPCDELEAFAALADLVAPSPSPAHRP